MATQDEIIGEAGEELKMRRNAIKMAADEPWCEEALGWLRRVTGLFLSSRTSCERVFPTVRGGPRFSFPTRIIYSSWGKLNLQNETPSPQDIVTFFLGNLPVVGSPERIFDVLGQYVSENDVIGARVEVFWAKIEAHCTEGSNLQPSSVARVVMLHELAHYVTHQGCSPSNIESYWRQFEISHTFFREVAAQKATADVIWMYARDLAETFTTMLERQSVEYTSHAEIPELNGA